MITRTIRNNLISWYIDYAYSFSCGDMMLPVMKKLKFDHSLRVCSLARKIAVLENFPESELFLAELCGIYHDIGRYEQFRRYKTFQDYNSINHAECGYQVMLKTGCLADLPHREQSIILESTRLHNVKSLPEGLESDIDRYTRLVRDADKLDIYFVIYDAIANNKLGDYPEITHGVDIDGGPSPIILAQVKKHQQINYAQMRSLVDFELILLQWVYEMNFIASYQILQSRNIIGKLASIMPDLPEVSELVDSASAFIADKVRIR